MLSTSKQVHGSGLPLYTQHATQVWGSENSDRMGRDTTTPNIQKGKLRLRTGKWLAQYRTVSWPVSDSAKTFSPPGSGQGTRDTRNM